MLFCLQVRHLTHERDSLNGQLDDLMTRHTILQRSIKTIEERKMTESHSLHEINARFQEAEKRASAMMQERDALRLQVEVGLRDRSCTSDT